MHKPAFEWFHQIKHDGYRLIVQRGGKTVRLWTRNGDDWSSRYPRIVEAALRHRPDCFVLDWEAVLLGVDGIADSTACTAESMMTRSSSMCWTS
jgi:bifunctional non-homologous end joining protein LigD